MKPLIILSFILSCFIAFPVNAQEDEQTGPTIIAQKLRCLPTTVGLQALNDDKMRPFVLSKNGGKSLMIFASEDHKSIAIMVRLPVEGKDLLCLISYSSTDTEILDLPDAVVPDPNAKQPEEEHKL